MRKQLKHTFLLCIIACLLFVNSTIVQASDHSTNNTETDSSIWTSDDFTISIPEGTFVLTPDTPTTDPRWAQAGIYDVSNELSEFNSNDINLKAIFCSDDGTSKIYIAIKSNSVTKSLYSYLSMTKEEFAKQEESFKSQDNATNAYDYEGSKFDHPQTPFFKVLVTAKEKNSFQELAYSTVINGYSINITSFNKQGVIAKETQQLQEDIVRSIHFTNIISKPEYNTMSTKELITGILKLVLLAVLVIGLSVYFRKNSKKEKKAAIESSERLGKLFKERQRQKDAGELSEEVSIATNSTKYSPSIIKKFTIYSYLHSFTSNLNLLLAFYLVLLGVCLIIQLPGLFVFGCFIGIIYFVYKLCKTPAKLQGILEGRYKASKEKSMHYEFYTDYIKVSGMQEPNDYYYIMLNDVQETKDYFYIYLSHDFGLIIDKSGFTKGNADEIRSLLKKAK